jgi:hypothetical protein
MRTKALLTSILLGSLSLAGVASASPIVRDHRSHAYTQPVYTQSAPQTYGFQVTNNGASVIPYNYGQDPWIEHAPRSSWITLGSQQQLPAKGVLAINGNGQRMRVLELQSEWSRLDVDLVRVVLEYGRVIDVRPDRTLDQHSPNLRIDLGNAAQCGIRRVAVYGSGNGTFRLIGA